MESSGGQSGTGTDTRTSGTGTNTVHYPKVVLATGAQGNVDWACASTTNTTANSQGLAAAPKGTLLARYAPTQCK